MRAEYRCDYCGKTSPSKSHLLRLKCQRHPKGCWQGPHHLNVAAAFLADSLGALAERKRLIEKIEEQQEAERAETKTPSHHNARLQSFSRWMISEWNSPAAERWRLDLIFALMLTRDVKIPAGEVPASQAPLLTQLQVDIGRKDFWQVVHWTAQIQYDVQSESEDQETHTIGDEDPKAVVLALSSEWDTDSTQRLVDGFSFGLDVLAVQNMGKMDVSELDTLRSLLTNSEFWQKVHWLRSIRVSL